MTDRKTIEFKEVGEEGTGLARIATLSAIDSDGDTYLPGAFGEQDVKVLPAHDTRAVPLGRARIFERGDEALAEFRLNLGTTAGRDWHSALKFDFESGRPIQEWSYGFRILDSSQETRGGDRVRVLKRLAVHEISPVVLGAGVGTGTLDMKSRAFEDQIAEVIERAKSVMELRAKDGRSLSADRLAQLAQLRDALDRIVRYDPRAAEKLLADYEAIRSGVRRGAGRNA